MGFPERTTHGRKSSWPTTFFVAILLSTALVPAPRTIAAPKPFTHRIVNPNIGMANRWIDTCIGRMRSAASLGYNGYVITNNEDNYLEDVSVTYTNNMKRAVAEAKKLKMALIPRHFHVLDVAQEDYNLAEAFPVRNTKFIVANGEARAVSDHETGFENGDFESNTANRPDGWKLINMPGATIQTSGPKSGNACLQISGAGPNAHIKQIVNLKPFRAYRLSVWVSTQGFKDYTSARFIVKDINTQKTLLFRKSIPFGTPFDSRNRGIWTTLSGTQNWRLCQNDFNSQQSTSAEIKFMVSRSGGQVGTIWLDDMRLEEVGLFETVRSKTRPITVQSGDGSKRAYEEGTDYIVDPKCDKFTVKSFWYQGHLKIPQGSAIKEGQELRVSWYQLADVQATYPTTNYCMSETWDALRNNIRNMDNIYGENKRLYVGLSEWRVVFWDDQCEMYPHAKTAGEYMGAALKTCGSLLRESNPCRELFVVSDMYDPYFNTYWPDYWMANGSVQFAWKNMDTTAVIIQWNACAQEWKEKSVRFYMGLDDSLNPEGKVYRQVLNVLEASQVGNWLNIVEKAEKEGGRGVIGVYYVDWGGNYSQMKPVKDACVARGRWGSGPMPDPTQCASIKSHAEPKPIAARLSVLPRSSKIFNIRYHLEQNANAKLSVSNILGRKVGVIAAGHKEMGTHQMAWDASALPTGIYFLHLSVNGVPRKAIKQMIM